MFKFIDNVRYELLGDMIDVFDRVSEGSLQLYDKITGNLIIILRTQLGVKKCVDKYLV